MKQRKLVWHLLPTYIAITAVSVIILGWVATNLTRSLHIDQIENDMRNQAYLVREIAKPYFNASHQVSLDSIAKDLGNISHCRITFIHPDGTILGDTKENPAAMENHSDRLEYKAAIENHEKTVIRFSTTLNAELMYLAIPVQFDNSENLGVIRLALPLTNISRGVHDVRRQIFLSVLIVTILAAILSYIVSRQITKPLTEIKGGAAKFAAGELNHRLAACKVDEFNSLANAANNMAQELGDRFDIINKQHGELIAVLSSMVEGVIAVDYKERLLNINQAALNLLNIRPEDWRDRLLSEIVRNTELTRFVQSILNTKENQETEIVLAPRGRDIQVKGTLLLDEKNREMGALLILNDVTRLRHLETVRRDFASNVSHELRTPITIIKGYVETICDSDFDDQETSKHFLEKALVQIDRLNAIIEDLLYLARLEEDNAHIKLSSNAIDLTEVIAKSIQICKNKADIKKIKLKLDNAEKLNCGCNPFLMERAFINLIDNAINYSPEGSEIHVGWTNDRNGITAYVKDNGVGIQPKHLTRLFERFYRANENRDRKSGGTGLGLAIVKHIALVHGGDVAVDSQFGEGSVFTITIPDKHSTRETTV